MSKTNLGAWAVGLGVAALTCVMLFAADGEAQRRGARRTGTPFVRATTGNITINMPIQDAPAGDAEPSRQALLGSTWACSATRAANSQIAVACESGRARVSFVRPACDGLTFSLSSPDAPAYQLEMGCE